MKKKKEKECELKMLLGSPTLEQQANSGRFKCVETGHEMLFKDIESYQQSKHCRLALIDAAISRKKLPFSMFHQHPHCKTKLICKLTGDTVNKTEDHIWKHINGSKFLLMLEEAGGPSRIESDKGIIMQTKQESQQATTDNEGSTKKRRDHARSQEDPVQEGSGKRTIMAEFDCSLLLESPTFEKMDNGRFKCIQTGHDVLLKDIESYKQSKHCRVALIDAAISQRILPFYMFKQDPHCKSKLICKLTGDTVNKSKEHIWKHIKGRKFLLKLEEADQKSSTEFDMELNMPDHGSNKTRKPQHGR